MTLSERWSQLFSLCDALKVVKGICCFSETYETCADDKHRKKMRQLYKTSFAGNCMMEAVFGVCTKSELQFTKKRKNIGRVRRGADWHEEL